VNSLIGFIYSFTFKKNKYTCRRKNVKFTHTAHKKYRRAIVKYSGFKKSAGVPDFFYPGKTWFPCHFEKKKKLSFPKTGKNVRFCELELRNKTYAS